MTTRWRIYIERRFALAHAYYLGLCLAQQGWTPAIRLAIDQLAFAVPRAGSGVRA